MAPKRAQRFTSRRAHKVMATAQRLELLAKAVPPARTQLHVLAGQGGLPPALKEQTDKALEERLGRLREMSAAAHAVVAEGLESLSDKKVTSRLWRLDEHQVQLDVMREP